jgi:hypothetical protein
MRPHNRGVEHLDQVRGPAEAGERLKEGLKHPGPAEAPEALPDRVPLAELGRQGAPGDVVEGEEVQRLQEASVVPALVAAPGASGGEHLQHDNPVLVRHPRQHGWSSPKPTRYESPTLRLEKPLTQSVHTA